MSFVFWFIKFFGPVAVTLVCTAAGIIAYYEGLPGLRDIPGISHVPVIREFIVGRVQQERSKAAEAAVEGLVARSELIAAKAEAERYRIQSIQNVLFADEARRQATTANAKLAAELAGQERKDEEDTDPDVSRWRQYDLDRLRGKAGAAAGEAR